MTAYELEDIKKKQQQHLDYGQRPSDHDEPNVLVLGPGEHMGGNRSVQPSDRFNLVYIILIIHGVGTLMPWNMFINAEDYFRKYKLMPHLNNSTTQLVQPQRDVSDTELAELRKNFLTYLSLAAQVPNVVFNGLNLLVNIGSGNLKLRVNLTLILEAIVFILTIVLAALDSSQWPGAFFYLTIVSVIILNMASGIYQNCIFGVGAKFSGAYTNAILIGSNFSGTFTSIVNLLSIWLAPAPQEAAMYYFVTALFVILICIVSYNLLPLNRFFLYHDNPNDTRSDQTDQDDNANISGLSKTLPINEMSDLKQAVDMMVPRNTTGTEDKTWCDDLKTKWNVLKKCWPQCFNVFFVFYVTLTLYPAVLANIAQTGTYFDKKYFTPFAFFFVFNACAMVGNLVTSLTTWPGRKYVWVLVVLRSALIPFFLFCNFNPASRQWKVLIENDLLFMSANGLLGFSAGYLSSLCMMFASEGLDPNEAPKAGMLAAFFLVLGIFLGLNSSFLLTWLVELK